MGQHRQHLLMQLAFGGGHHQIKKSCIWGLGLVVPFLVLFCIFPSGTSQYRPPYNHIVVSQLQIPPLRTEESHHNPLPSDEIHHRKDEDTPSKPDLASKKAKRRSDGILLKKSTKQYAGIKTEMSITSPKKEEKQRKEEYNGRIIKTLIDKELDQQTDAEDVQIKKSSKRGKMKHNVEEISKGATDEGIFFSGTDEDDEALHTGKSRSGRKSDKEKEEISAWGKRNGANEEDPMHLQPKSTSSKLEDSIADAEEEGVSFSGKEKGGKQRLRNDRASDLLFLENADKAVLLMKSAEEKREQSGEEEEDERIDSTSLPFSTKQSGKCRYYEGRWTIDSTYSLYKDSNCSWTSIDDQKTCTIKMKRKAKPTKWRWQPSHCNMEHFKVETFFKIMQRKSLAFVGDKLAKAQMQSLLCLLAQVEKPNLVYEDNNNKSMSWHFRSSNFTISMIWSPYLVQEVKENGATKLCLDKLDTKWAVMVPTLDVLVLGVGSLFIEPTIYMIRDEVVGCYACKELNGHDSIINLKETSLYSGFRATMRSTLMGIGALPGFKGITLFLQPFGFEGNGSYHSVSMKMKEIQEEELYQAYKRGSISNQSKMEVLHTYFTSMRKYDEIQGPRTSTCLIPSPLAETWNQVLQHTLAHLFNHNSYT